MVSYELTDDEKLLQRTHVLILIVVEDGLVLRSDNGKHMLIMVLILIVVEDGLVLIVCLR